MFGLVLVQLSVDLGGRDAHLVSEQERVVIIVIMIIFTIIIYFIFVIGMCFR
jgi:hypothetical protein